MTFDITDRKRIERELAEERAHLERRVAERTADLAVANAELARAVRLKDELLANMSHELRTPLFHVLGLIERLGEIPGAPLAAEQARIVERVEGHSRRLLAIINDVLDLTRTGVGDLSLTREPVVVAELVEACIQLVKQPAMMKLQAVEVEYDPRVRLVEGDGRRLRQILFNLLSNAVKFTPEGGRIGLRVTATREAVQFAVWDTGIGIAADQLEHIFQPFVQSEGHLARPYEGTGLGLALVRRLAELHGGQVTVTSELGAGSRFTVSLPTRRGDPGERGAV
jgi:signal transduction histidine kinase